MKKDTPNETIAMQAWEETIKTAEAMGHPPHRTKVVSTEEQMTEEDFRPPKQDGSKKRAL